MSQAKGEIKHLAIAIAGTRRPRSRLRVDRIMAARSLAALRDMYGSNKAVGRKVGICAEMVREFLSLLNLSPSALRYWETGKITSVDKGYRISARLPRRDHAEMARLILKRNLTCNDIDAITSYRKQHPQVPLRETVDRVLKSKDRVVYVADYTIEGGLMQRLRDNGAAESHLWSRIKCALKRVAGPKNVVACEQHSGSVRLKVKREGLRRLRERARRAGIPLKALAADLASRLASKAGA